MHPLPRLTSLRSLLLAFDWDLLLLLDGLFLESLGGRKLTRSGNKLFQVSIHGMSVEMKDADYHMVVGRSLTSIEAHGYNQKMEPGTSGHPELILWTIENVENLIT
ncbi:hypothetical protein DL96DRAFT_1556668 [Flagelloscypha sp. PMI_526]|nr:hypothetical protein DL96DRAFT_1556668 [Flagelloscypha sp. PMI_526]